MVTQRADFCKDNLKSRLNRVEGQVRGIKKMVEKGSTCEEILIQVKSVQAALDAVGDRLVEDYVKRYLLPRLSKGEPEATEELLIMFRKR